MTVFLVASGVDWVRKGAAEVAHLNPVDPPTKQLIGNLMSNGGSVLVCPPCAKVRGYSQEELLDGVTVAGAPAMLEIGTLEGRERPLGLQGPGAGRYPS